LQRICISLCPVKRFLILSKTLFLDAFALPL